MSGIPVTIDQGSLATISGSNDQVTLNAILTSNKTTATAINGSGQNTYIENAHDGLNGYVPEPVGVTGAASLTATEGVLNVGAAPGATNLNGVSVNVGANGDVNLDNTDATVSMGQNSSAYVTDGATATLNVSGTTLSGTLTGNPTGSTVFATSNGAVGALTLQGSGAALSVSGLGQAIIQGDTNTVTLSEPANQGASTSPIVTAVNQAGETNTFVENASDTGIAKGDVPEPVTITGAASVTTTGGVANIAAAPGAANLNGTTVNVGENDDANLDSSGATANLQNNASVYLTPGATALLNCGSLSGTLTTAATGTTAVCTVGAGNIGTLTDATTGGTLTLNGTGQLTEAGGGNSIIASGSIVVNILDTDGISDTFTDPVLTTTPSQLPTINIENSAQASVNANGATVTQAANSAATINGNSDTDTLSANAQAILDGMNEAVTSISGDVQLAANTTTAFVVGSGTVVSDVSGVSGGTVTITGAGDTAALNNGAVNFGASGETLTVTGTNDALNGGSYTGDTVTLGANNLGLTDNATGLTLQDGSGFTGGTVTLGSNSLVLNDSASGLIVQDGSSLRPRRHGAAHRHPDRVRGPEPTLCRPIEYRCADRPGEGGPGRIRRHGRAIPRRPPLHARYADCARETLTNAQVSLASGRHDAYVADALLLNAVGRLEARVLLQGQPLYQPQVSFRRNEHKDAVPWEIVPKGLDWIGAPGVVAPGPFLDPSKPSGPIILPPSESIDPGLQHSN